ncbi:MFS general substrate transporter [Calocera cornea HHB12733]|uniref:Autophagy-related protein n=1 Tax=Calocera cornea HHB12733 TaxID=1353952 RepID=A0A165CTW2_9BASI|nr:MFS general substrate transporter [Calocera cornea HHB12733]
MAIEEVQLEVPLENRNDAGKLSLAEEQERQWSVDRKWTTSRAELWAYYIYYIGDNGLAGLNFGPSQFQNLLYLAGWDQADPTRSTPCVGDAVCVLPFAGSIRDVIGAWADYGTWRPNILTAFTAVAIAVSFGWLGVANAAKWQAAVGLYIVGLITYQGTITFWTAAFPALARNLPHVQEERGKLASGVVTREQYDLTESLARNMVQNIAFAVQSAGELVILAVMVGILNGLRSDASTENNTWAFSVLIAFAGGVWLLCALPWVFLEKKRPGNDLPPGASMVTIGFVQTYVAFRQCLKLKQTFIYLVFYFLMGDALNTTVTVIGTIQNEIVYYSTLQLTYLLIVGIFTQLIGIYAFWRVQKHFQLSTKTMLIFNCIWIILLALWGLIGVWTPNFGFKHVWEIWAYQAYYGMMVCPWYAYSMTFVSEVIPHGKEFLFYALFSIIGKTSSFIGPFVTSAIIDRANGNNSMAFAFLFALTMVSVLILFVIDVPKSKRECEAFLQAEAEQEGLEVKHGD